MTILEDIVEKRGHVCMFYPKFHCELSPIERVRVRATATTARAATTAATAQAAAPKSGRGKERENASRNF